MQEGAVASRTAHDTTANLAQFHLVTVAHPRLAAAKDRLMSAISDAAPGSLILVIGPTGVGKTTVRLKAEQLIGQQMRPALDDDPGRIPYVSIEAVAPESGNFSWRDHFYRILEQMNEALLNHKLRANQCHFERDEVSQLPWAACGSGIGLHHAVEQALKHRRPAVVFIDEAQHLARMASGRRLSDQLDVIKSMANRTGTIHVLLGTYDLLAFCDLSGQLSRRSIYVHFRRYLAEDPEEVEIFQNVLMTFRDRLPIPETPGLMADWEFLYERSAGCVGVLKEWLERAAAQAVRRGSQSLGREDLRATALSVSQCEKILAESREGERRLTDTEESQSRLRILLGLGSSALPTKGATRFPEVGKATVPPVKKRQRAGRRRPHRDRIGIHSVGSG
jgi:energy-coupling factor transporter ATP-binding protein EcfA2